LSDGDTFDSKKQAKRTQRTALGQEGINEQTDKNSGQCQQRVDNGAY
jgi:hypothetical protein